VLAKYGLIAGIIKYVEMEEIFVEQLLVGYANESAINEGYSAASGSVTLIIDGARKILVDCGDPWNGEALLSALRDNALSTSEITDLIITHGHIDHCGDIFEDENPDRWEPNSRYVSEQERSRNRILAIADWIIPGHGAIFRNKFKKALT
uniref:Metallo-beta-lactamase domain-containing protein n=1 Tax=Parascaris univalens TaxID=6257 RepID=A0A915B7Y8_PARUN